MIDLTKATMIQGSGGAFDYLKIAEKDGVDLGLKIAPSTNIQGNTALVFRVRAAATPEKDAKDGNACAATYSSIPFVKRNQYRASVDLVIPCPVMEYDKAENIVMDFRDAQIGMAVVQAVFGGIEELIYTERELADYVNSKFTYMIEDLFANPGFIQYKQMFELKKKTKFDESFGAALSAQIDTYKSSVAAMEAKGAFKIKEDDDDESEMGDEG